MKAIRAYAYGGPEVLTLEDIADPVPGEGEVLIDVAGSGVNPVDWKILEGRMKAFLPLSLPYTPGVDVSGKVSALGAGVRGFAVGDHVFGYIGIVGGYATKVIASTERLALVPNKLSPLEAAGVPAAALTAWQALHEHAGVKPGQRVLIHGAAGGVGSMAVQFARIAGASVIGTASSGNLDYVRQLGATQVIDYQTESFEQIVSSVDIVLDLVGGETQDRSWSLLKAGGTLVSPVSPPDAERARLAGVVARHFATRSDGKQLTAIAAYFDSGELSVEVETIFPLSHAADALKKSLTRHAHGKVVLDATQ
ncbi:NADP-dependent oxidoreductase [Paraburkholderia sp. FT54]|uniref:NADP-dependent oxidoreductase n=1 Tax=Paraburkholderia sp. FT54 TaxID=3074437 RepID=UPI002877A615|nr:NADP-dependent oxidoreductase [Paraburkholderia sp. FT54]WNC94435.1 NADP-dependent oxidoreductase [Paraburkholderia sp. FT54]